MSLIYNLALNVDDILALILLLSMSMSALVLFQGVRAPYGRYNEEKALHMCWGLKINARIAWFVQEVPSLFVPLLMMVRSNVRLAMANQVLLAMFLGHYVNRSIIFPLRIKHGKPSPIGVILAAFIFCSINGYLQANYHLNYFYPQNWLFTLYFRLGFVIFLGGAYLNISSDAKLRSLRVSSSIKGGYAIPRGGLFEFVSAANYSAELLEWIGYTIATGFAFPAIVFLCCTFLNLAPRALSHHEWYREKFKGEYPDNRRALIPYLF
mmetsp:Transcript_3016/g.4196  ORF Transcript_3016/g.4196 Transcript_3016/m.4196 type:complete len:266 (+) Transcript_3016:46-843(+)